MTLSDLTLFIKDIISVNLPELPVIVEDKGDIDFEATNALNKQGIYALVRIPTMTYQGQTVDDKLSLTATSMLIQISENIPVNRHQTDYITVHDYAIKVGNVIQRNLPHAANLLEINIDYVEGLLVATISFETTFQITD